jgi:predicted enzyme related to lactoylglutathione lyase
MGDAIRLEHVGIWAQGDAFEPTVAFYKEAFGWTHYREMDYPSRIVFLKDGQGGIIEILDQPGAPMAHPNHLSFAMPVADYPAKRAQLESMGRVFDLVLEMPSGDVVAYFNDPAGNRAQIVGRTGTFG